MTKGLATLALARAWTLHLQLAGWSGAHTGFDIFDFLYLQTAKGLGKPSLPVMMQDTDCSPGASYGLRGVKASGQAVLDYSSLAWSK